MSVGAEYLESEKPMLDQLTNLGWSHVEGSKFDPGLTQRESFHESILEPSLRRALYEINLNEEGLPWLDESRISEAVSALNRTELVDR